MKKIKPWRELLVNQVIVTSGVAFSTITRDQGTFFIQNGGKDSLLFKVYKIGDKLKKKCK